MASPSAVNQNHTPRFNYYAHNIDALKNTAYGKCSQNRCIATIQKIARFTVAPLLILAVYEVLKNLGILLANTGLLFANTAYKCLCSRRQVTPLAPLPKEPEIEPILSQVPPLNTAPSAPATLASTQTKASHTTESKNGFTSKRREESPVNIFPLAGDATPPLSAPVPQEQPDMTYPEPDNRFDWKKLALVTTIVATLGIGVYCSYCYSQGSV